MAQNYDEVQERKAYTQERHKHVLKMTAIGLAVALVIALLLNLHPFGLFLAKTAKVKPNFGNTAPCAVKGDDGKAKYSSYGSVGIRVLNGTTHSGFAKAVGEALSETRGFSLQSVGNYDVTNVERTTIYFGKNAINQAYTLAGNFTDATMIMTAREDQLIDVVLGATFSELQDTKSSPVAGDTIKDIEGCVAADSMTDLPADTQHDKYPAS